MDTYFLEHGYETAKQNVLKRLHGPKSDSFPPKWCLIYRGDT